jgi:DNA-binding transcriptional LysR family regulator
MALKLPPLSGLRLFEAAARCGSFKRAAQELNLTPGALSHGSIRVSMGESALESAIGGLGLAIGRLPLIDEDIAAGRIAIAADNIVPATTGYWLIKSPGSETRREVVAFRSWLLKEMSQLKWNGAEARAAAHLA